MDGSKGLFGILKGCTSISRMQIYTDDYFSVFNMMVPTLKVVDSGILSQIVHGPRSVWITSIHAERYRIIAFVHAYMNTCAYVVPPALDDDVTFDLASSASIKCTSFVLQVVMQDQHSYPLFTCIRSHIPPIRLDTHATSSPHYIPEWARRPRMSEFFVRNSGRVVVLLHSTCTHLSF